MKAAAQTMPSEEFRVASTASGGVVPESRAARAYRRIYSALCGIQPDLRPWHYQWLSATLLTRTFRALLPPLSGRVLDVGCGEKPYRALFDRPAEYVGLDIAAGPKVDIVVRPGERWPLS
ncbi:MAG TPA: hypothetical protein VJ865_02480, partial [Gemmatimonadaceae bacterium]|nr:hypothetical protein [Gemmatimonadaceae bacterium]